jgi:hypothetical protein
LLFDSQNNQWIFVHQSAPGAAVTSSMLLMGPQTFNNIGNETALTANRVPKASGADLGEHLTDSNISDTGTSVSINSNTEITGSLKVIGNTYITGGLITYFDDTGTNPGLYTPVLDTVNSSLYTYEGASFSRLSIEYGATRALYDLQGPGQQISLNWGNRNLVNTNGTNVLNWNNGITISGSTQITGSLTTRMDSTNTVQLIGSSSNLQYLPDSVGGDLRLQGTTTGLPRITVLIPSSSTKPTAGFQFGMRTWDDTIYSGYGKVGDAFFYGGNETNGVNFMNPVGTGTEDYIRFYAGKTANNQPDIHIQGSGSTIGNVGIGKITPNAKLDVNGSVIITGSLSVTSVGNNTGSFVTINGNNTLNSRTAAQVRVDINYYGLTYAMQNGYY